MAESKIAKASAEFEKKVVGAYNKIEDAVVGAYTKIEDKFVESFLTKDGESVTEAKQRIKKERM